MCTNKTKFFKSASTLLLTYLLAVLPSKVMAQEFTVDGLVYQVVEGSSTECEVASSLDKSLSGEISIPENVEYNGASYTVVGIRSSAFFNCKTITGIFIPKSVTSIGKNAFKYCSALTNIYILGAVTSIEDKTFQNCYSLVNITLPISVTSIGKYAFDGCSSLTSITIPESVMSIGERAFSGCCSSLTSIVVKEGNSMYDSRGNCNAIIETKSNTLIYGCSTTKIPESVTEIGGSAFEGCSSLTSIAIPESVTEIGGSAFEGCSSLTSIAIPESVTEIGGSVFEDCSSLTSISIPKSVTKIGGSAFADCSSLTSITIPESVTRIERSAFTFCSSLIEITCLAVIPPYASKAFGNLRTRDITLRVPEESVEAYASNQVWREFIIVGFAPTGIADITSENGNPAAIYSLDGKKVSGTQKGRIYLHRYGNGKTVKRMAK